MKAHELILLSPYNYPAHNSMSLADDEMAAWMNAYSALWHPAVLWKAAGPPRVDIPYDHDQPKENHIYALPESPPSLLPDDWKDKVKAACAAAFRSSRDRAETLRNLEIELSENPKDPDSTEELHEVRTKLLQLETDKIRPFFAIGMGYLLLESLSEAMQHENLLDREAFWQDIQNAIASLAGVEVVTPTDGNDVQANDPKDLISPVTVPATDNHDGGRLPEPMVFDAPESAGRSNGGQPFEPGFEPWYAYLRSAAQRLLSAREVLYPVTIYLLDLVVLDEQYLDASWPEFVGNRSPWNVIASTALLEKLQQKQPQRFAELKCGVNEERIEVCGGCYREREDALLPVESQIWNLKTGLAKAQELLGRPIEVFARKRFAAHPQLPLFLSCNGVNRALITPTDDFGIPQYSSCVVSWPSADGKQVDVFVRQPRPAEDVDTYFNLGHHLFKTIREDHSATLAFMHTANDTFAWHNDFVELARFGPILGEWMTMTRYFNEVTSGDYTGALQPDEFHFDYLTERVPQNAQEQSPTDFPVSGMARHLQLRRRIDTVWTLAAFQRALFGSADPVQTHPQLKEIEDEIETVGPSFAAAREDLERELDEIQQGILKTLSTRLLARAVSNQPGYLLINPCGYARRVALELPRPEFALPIEGPVKACQLDREQMRLVAEVPALGFAWFPRSGPQGTPLPTMRMRLADDRHVRNEFFEAEIDVETGGLKGIADHRNRISRLAQRLVFNPGSTMTASSIQATSTGPALGEVVSEGALLGQHQQVLARYRQRFRAWLGRPVLELRIEIHPEQPPAGYPWHAYFGARFAWRDERATLLRGINGTSYVTYHTRPQTPDFLEIRGHRQNTVVFPGGMPFVQRHETRMFDVILIPQGETCRVFELAIGLDREHPMLTAQGLSTPMPMIETASGPPHVGATGWLFHLDVPNLLLLGMRPGGEALTPTYYGDEAAERRTAFDAITAHLLEVAAQSGHAEFRCVRNPVRAATLNARGDHLLENTVFDDIVSLEVTPGDYNHVQIEFC